MFTDTFIVFHFSLFFTRENHPSVLPPEQHPRNYIPLWAFYCFQSLGGRQSSVQKSLAETFTGIICDNVNSLVCHGQNTSATSPIARWLIILL